MAYMKIPYHIPAVLPTFFCSIALLFRRLLAVGEARCNRIAEPSRAISGEKTLYIRRESAFPTICYRVRLSTYYISLMKRENVTLFFCIFLFFDIGLLGRVRRCVSFVGGAEAVFY